GGQVVRRAPVRLAAARDHDRVLAAVRVARGGRRAQAERAARERLPAGVGAGLEVTVASQVHVPRADRGAAELARGAHAVVGAGGDVGAARADGGAGAGLGGARDAGAGAVADAGEDHGVGVAVARGRRVADLAGGVEAAGAHAVADAGGAARGQRL